MKKIAALKNHLFGLLILLIASSAAAVVNVTISAYDASKTSVTATGSIIIPSTATSQNISSTYRAKFSSSPIFTFKTTTNLTGGVIFPVTCGSSGFSGSVTYPSAGTASANKEFEFNGNTIWVKNASVDPAGATVTGINDSFLIATPISTIATAAGLTNGSFTCSWGAGATADSMVVTVNLAAPVLSADATLSAMTLSTGALSPAFASGTNSYTASVANSVSSLTVTPTRNQANATITVNGTAVTSGSASGSIPLNVGSNTITTVVTAQDGTTTQTYTTTVTRAASASNVATLSAMTISSGTLSPIFASGTGTYTASVTNATASITVTPTVTQANATITVNGAAVTSGSASGAISLSVGSNTITTVVTAQDGTTTQTYTTTVTRAALLAQAALTVSASPTMLNATTTTSTLSTSGGSGTGAVSYAMTAGTCTLSGTTVTAGSASETCTVTATKASDGTYAAATATVSITVAKRATIAAAAADSSVTTLHAAQVMQAQKFAVTQVQNVTAHLDSLRHNFTLQPSNLGIGLNIPSFSGPMSQVFYKIKDELTYQAPAKQVSQRSNLSSPASSYSSTPFLKTASVDEGAPKPFNDYLNDPSKDKQDNQQEQSQPDEAPQGYYKRESLTYSFWTAGTIDVGTFMTGQKDALNKLRASGLTFGLDYKLDDAAIVGGAIGVGKGWINDNSSSSNIQSNQLTFTGYGMVALDGTWIVDGLAGYGRMDISGIRTTSDGSAVLGMSRRGDTFFSSISVSKLYWIGGLKISPFIREDWIKINLGSYSETGAADYALGYDGTNIINTKSSAGLFIVHDEYLERGKLTTSAKFAMNVAKTGDIQQNIYYVDTGSSGGTATLSQLSTNQVSQSVTLGMLYTQKSGDSFDIGFTQAVGANQYKQSSYRFTLRFAM